MKNIWFGVLFCVVFLPFNSCLSSGTVNGNSKYEELELSDDSYSFAERRANSLRDKKFYYSSVAFFYCSSDGEVNFGSADHTFSRSINIENLFGKKRFNDPVEIKVFNDLSGPDEQKKLYTISYYMQYPKVYLEKIEGFVSKEEFDALVLVEKNKIIEAERTKKEADEKARIENNALLDKKATIIAKGYIYHGINETGASAKLFDSGALETGHAYYISAYMIYANGAMGGAITSLFVDPQYHYVDFISQKVKGEVVGAGQTMFGTLPIAVVIAGGKPPLYTPIILGLVE